MEELLELLSAVPGQRGMGASPRGLLLGRHSRQALQSPRGHIWVQGRQVQGSWLLLMVKKDLLSFRSPAMQRAILLGSELPV